MLPELNSQISEVQKVKVSVYKSADQLRLYRQEINPSEDQ